MRNKVVHALGTAMLIAALASKTLAQDAGADSNSAADPPASSLNAGTTITALPTDPPAVFTLASQIILRLKSTSGGLTPQQRVDTLTGRIANLLGTPGITPADVTVYAPKGKAPAIYALGRRMLTVDASMVQAAGGGNPLTIARQWAARLQQTLPLANYRPPNAPEPKIPPHPPLLVTSDSQKSAAPSARRSCAASRSFICMDRNWVV